MRYLLLSGLLLTLFTSCQYVSNVLQEAGAKVQKAVSLSVAPPSFSDFSLSSDKKEETDSLQNDFSLHAFWVNKLGGLK